MIVKKRTVGVIGMGHVGAHVAFTLGMMGIADDILICDKNEDKLCSERQDLMDAVQFMPHRVTYSIAGYEELGNCDVIINCVGDITLVATGSRDDEMKFTATQVADYIPKVMKGGFNGIFVNVTNPCDVITYLIQKLSGLPKNQVLGTGTGLDTSRLVSAISQQTGIEQSSFTAFMMGEHGDSQMVPWSFVSFSGKSLNEMERDPKFTLNREDTKNLAIRGGWITYKGKHCTEYGICSTAATIVKSILHNQGKVMAASVPFQGEYGEQDIYCGCPAVIGANGVQHIVEYPLPADEMAEFKTCCAKIRGNIAKAEDLLGKGK
ncbi:lactate/malate family dehydrogenase [Megasphaera sueciensis]|uniref:lactate/malate family dehydrogenase n=1 Tax=Megasphaera sueciensis TaxID=349094 RepID=UPI003CFF97C8